MLTPRPADLTLTNWDLGGPRSRWAYAHATRLFPTAVLRPGHPAPGLPQALVPAPPALAHELAGGLVAGVSVLVGGRVAFRWPEHGGARRLLMSVSKIVPSLAIGLLAERGEIDVEAPIRTYLPDLGPQWDGCRLLDVADMASGVECPEAGDPGSYQDPTHPFYRFEASLGWRPAETAATPYDLARSYARTGTPGTTYAYTSVNTFLLAWVIEAVTGRPYAAAVQHLIWNHLALGGESALAVNAGGAPVAHGGLIMTTDDVARLGAVFTPSAARLGHRLAVPASYGELLHRSRPLVGFGPAGTTPALQWDWVAPDGDLFKGGFGGQGLLVSPRRDLVLAFTGTPGDGGQVHGLRELAADLADAFA